MKFAVSVALLTLFLAMPVSCLLLPCQAPNPAHECCPRTKVFFKCPYDVMDAAKATAHGASDLLAGLPVSIAPVLASIASRVQIDFSITPEVDGSDLHIKNRILRI